MIPATAPAATVQLGEALFKFSIDLNLPMASLIDALRTPEALEVVTFIERHIDLLRDMFLNPNSKPSHRSELKELLSLFSNRSELFNLLVDKLLQRVRDDLSVVEEFKLNVIQTIAEFSCLSGNLRFQLLRACSVLTDPKLLVVTQRIVFKIAEVDIDSEFVFCIFFVFIAF